MNLGEIVSYTTAQLGIDDLTARDRAATIARARWSMIWNHSMWRQSRHVDTVAVAASQAEVVLPALFDLVHAVRLGADQTLEAVLDTDALWLDPGARDHPGHTAAFAVLGKSEAGAVRLHLLRPPQQATTLLVMGKRAAPALAVDTDAPVGLPGVDECLCAFVLGDLHRWIRQHGKAQGYFQEANALLAKMVEIETAQNAGARRVIPYVQQQETCADLGWLG